MPDHRNPKEAAFRQKWGRTRVRGKLRYVAINGVLIGLSIFVIWLGITLLESYFSAFKQAVYEQNPGYFLRRCLLWLGVQLLLGCVVAWNRWEAREKKWANLSK